MRWGGIGGVCVFVESCFFVWFGIMSRIESAVPWPPHARAAPRAMAFLPWVMCFKVMTISSMSPMKIIVFFVMLRLVVCFHRVLGVVALCGRVHCGVPREAFPFQLVSFPLGGFFPGCLLRMGFGLF